MSDLNFNDLTSNLQEIGKDAIFGMKARNLLTTFDLFIIGMINRNLSLIEAVSYLHSQKNLIAVIPLLRIVLDSNLRLIGVFHCSDPFVYIEYFTKGECSVLEKVVIERQEKMTTTTRYSEAFKRKVIQSIEEGKYNQ
ncbi:hypothetical protein QMM87_16805, partial [Leptospira santarosai]|nr:hypothetical protein [Leptospira santarosai]